MEKVNLAEKLALIAEHWRPKVVGELNGQEVKLVKCSCSSRRVPATLGTSRTRSSRRPRASVSEIGARTGG